MKKGLLKDCQVRSGSQKKLFDEVSFIPVKAFAKKAEFARDYLMLGNRRSWWKARLSQVIMKIGYREKIYTTEVYANQLNSQVQKWLTDHRFQKMMEGFLEIPEGMEEEMPFR